MSVPYFTCALTADTWMGVYYGADSPTITIQKCDPLPGTLIGATEWWVRDGKGAIVASGTCAVTDTSITVATSGVWTSGGDVVVGAYQFYVNQTVPPVFGGGVSKWNFGAGPPSTTGKDCEIWWGVIDTSGSSTLTVSFGNESQESVYVVSEYASSVGANAVWVQEAALYQSYSSSTTVPFPSLTAPSSGLLYTGVGYSQTAFSTTGPSGYTWDTANPYQVGFLSNTDVSSGVIAPSVAQSPAGAGDTVAAILSPGSGTISLINSWTGNNTNGGGYEVTVDPSAVGNLLVLCHGDFSPNSFPSFPAQVPQGCYFYVCPTGSGFNPIAEGYTLTSSPSQDAPSAWMGVAQERGLYQCGETSVGASAIATTLASDPCFTGAWIDSARPRTKWLATNYQGSTLPSWGAIASDMTAAGLTGWTYELPSNEPENGGLSSSTTITYINDAITSVLSADSTAKFLIFCSGGIPEDTPFTTAGTILAGASQFQGVSAHNESTTNNQPELTMLRYKWAQSAAMIQASPNPAAPLWATETGMLGCYYGVYHPRRMAAQVTKFLLTREAYGWAKELVYFFSTQVEGGGGTLPTGFIEQNGTLAGNGNMRMGAYAAHIMYVALYGTTCTPTSKPAQLDFGPAGSVGDSLFFGLHYSSSVLSRDVIVLATNGIGYTAGETVILDVSSTTGLLVWNGLGQDITADCTVSGTTITIPVDDLLTYVFLPLNATVSVVDTGSKMITVGNVVQNLLTAGGNLVNESGSAITGLAWDNGQGENGLAPALPYIDTTIPSTASTPLAFGSAVYAWALKSCFPWNGSATSGTAPGDFTLKLTFADGTTQTITISNPTMTSVAVPGSPCSDTAVRTTYWDHAYAWAQAIDASSVVSVELETTVTSLTGEPDTAAIDTGPFYTVAVENLQICDFQVFGNWSPVPGGSPAPAHLTQLGGA